MSLLDNPSKHCEVKNTVHDLIDNPSKHCEIKNTVHDLIDWDIWIWVIRILLYAGFIGLWMWICSRGGIR